MLRGTLLTLTFVCICIFHTSCLNNAELRDIVDAFDTLVDDVPRSNKAKDKDIEDDNLDKVEVSEVELQSPVEEEVVVRKEAYCTGCPYDLDITNSDVIDLAKDALNDIKDGNSYGFVKLIKASAEVENGYTYNLKVEGSKSLEDGSAATVLCVLELKKAHGAENRPTLTYHNCLEN